MAAIDLGSVMGPQGPQGSIWYQGTAITGTSTTAAVFSDSGIEEARVYDKYFNTGTNDVYTCTVAGDADTAKWAWIGNLRGAQGNIGPVGPTGSVDMNTPIEFTEAETMANIESGESVSTIFGKLKKVVGDLLAGAASSLLGQKLTASRALIADADGNVGVSGITSTELGYLDGVTGNIQGQIGNLSALSTTAKGSLVEALNEQNVNKENKLTFDVSKVINFMSGITVYHTKCRRYGKLCVGYFNCKITKEFTANSVIATVPFTAESWTFIPLRNATSFNSRGSISSGSNEIKIEFTIPANTDIIGEFIWFTND